MKIIQEENYEYAMRNEVEPYLAAHCRDKFVTGAKEDGQGKTTRAAKLHVKFYETERCGDRQSRFYRKCTKI